MRHRDSEGRTEFSLDTSTNLFALENLRDSHRARAFSTSRERSIERQTPWSKITKSKHTLMTAANKHTARPSEMLDKANGNTTKN